MKINAESLAGGTFGNLVTALGLVNLQDMESIIGMICLVVGCLITIISSVIIPVIKWWKKAKADKKITTEELDELKTIVDEGKKEIEDYTENHK